MTTSSRLLVGSILGVLLLLASSGAAHADDECDLDNTVCAVDTYPVFFLKSAFQCPPYGGRVKACRFTWEPPYPASLNCEYNYHGYLCEAWPQGDTLRYAYSTTGSIRLPYPVAADAPFAGVSCWTSGSGSLTVTITSTAAPGQSSVVSSSLYCP